MVGPFKIYSSKYCSDEYFKIFSLWGTVSSIFARLYNSMYDSNCSRILKSLPINFLYSSGLINAFLVLSI